MTRRKARVAIVYDFDGTLSPGNMQEYDFFPKLGMSPQQFWTEAKKRVKNSRGRRNISIHGPDA